MSGALMYLSAVLILWCDSTGALYRPAGNNAEAQLTDLKRRYEAGWLSDRQYKLKREEILEKL